MAVGLKGDLNVIDWDKVDFGRPYVAKDLPAGGRRLLQNAEGYRATVVSGQTTYRDGAATGALPGQLCADSGPPKAERPARAGRRP